jgi:putative DNA primase/helicase
LKSRVLALDDDVAGSVIRWNPRIGAMIALFRNIQTNEPQAVSRTFLDHEGRKLGRKFLGPVGGAAIKLDADEEVLSVLHIGEGVETCMAARQLGLRPAWARGSSGAIGRFPVLSGVECLTTLLELDAGASDAASAECAERWHKAGLEVVTVAPKTGKDLNDAIRGGA